MRKQETFKDYSLIKLNTVVLQIKTHKYINCMSCLRLIKGHASCYLNYTGKAVFTLHSEISRCRCKTNRDICLHKQSTVDWPTQSILRYVSEGLLPGLGGTWTALNGFTVFFPVLHGPPSVLGLSCLETTTVLFISGCCQLKC